MSEEVRTKIPIDTSAKHYARPWQKTQEELVSLIRTTIEWPWLTLNIIGCLWRLDEKKD